MSGEDESSSQSTSQRSSPGRDSDARSSEDSNLSDSTDGDTNATENEKDESSNKELATFLKKFKVPKSDKAKKRRKIVKNEFIDDEAELSGDDEISEDELEDSDDDQNDLDLVDKEAPELDSEEEEKVRKLYQKQLETEDRRAVLLLQEQFEDNDVAIGQRRRRKFRWQAREIMENSLRRHYDPDDDDSQDCDDEDGDYEFDDIKPRLRRPTAETLLIGSTKLVTNRNIEVAPVASTSEVQTSTDKSSTLEPSLSEDSNSASSRPATSFTSRAQPNDMNRYLFRDKELVQALSTKETVVVSREIRDKNIQREVQRMIQSKSIFDSLYS